MRRTIIGIVAALCTMGGAAQAADYPSRAIMLIQGYAPGGSADTISRLLAQPMYESMGVPVVVEPKPGAGGTLAANTLARAKPDGYTIGLVTGGHAVAKGLYKTLPFDPVDDFEPISNVVDYSFVLAVPANSPYKTLAELLAKAKEDPAAINFGSAGVGSTQHLAGVLLANAAGVTITHIPYRGEAAAVTGILSGEIPMIVASPVTLESQIRSGKMRALAVFSDKRLAAFPDVPTMGEAGIKDFSVVTWAGLVAPKGTPEPIVKRLHDEVVKALANPETKAKIEAAVGGEVKTSTPAEMRKRIATEADRWVKVVKDAGIEQQ
ncbi:Bug family tripartite tricarboxylate transporter substrate binding protein [Aquabacter cavernae]|uniref:Bug family tripartite tricarboxylate transporter substrate binding protein n=1 Tax=Aquabacter cavernae TaxID=2496029 RepID=UPI000F8F7B52|nr:tripartite tricarboxylate transporter substrate binding protein [Aquabacter cavernae]